MPDNAGTLETLVLELGTALKPLQDLLQQNIFTKLGVDLPSSIKADPTLATKIDQAATKLGELDPKITALANAISAGDEDNIISSAIPVIENVIEAIVKLTEMGTALHDAVAGLPAAERDELQEFAEKMAVRMLEFVAVGYLDLKFPSLTTTLSLLGIIDKEFEPIPGADPTSEPFNMPRRFYFDRFPKLFSNPGELFEQSYGWGKTDFDGQILLRKIHDLLNALGLPANLYTSAGNPTILEAYFFKIETDPIPPKGLFFELSLPGNVEMSNTFDFSELWKGTLDTKASFVAGLGATLKPPFNFNVNPPSGSVEFDVNLGLKAEKDSGEPIILIGKTGGSRLEAKSIGGGVGLNANFSTSSGEVIPNVNFEVKDGKLVIDFSESDGFLKDILSGVNLEGDFSFLGYWDPENGLKLQGSGGIELMIPVHIDLSVLEINGIYLGASFTPEVPLKIDLATQLTANLGPLAAVVDRLGASIPITFPDDGDGNLGFANIDFEFLPPKGVGLSLDTGVIIGGGFLYLDYDKGEYFGALELSFEGTIALKAIGIINTQMPDGSDGFAMLILITAEFTPIQLGFGFTLSGVGGLLALNRSLDTEALRLGVRTGAVNNILFPEDVVANIIQIISDLKTIFPIVQGHFVIAPMAQLGWGTPTLISLEIGIILDIPKPAFVIVGVLRCILPTEEAPILKLQVNFAGGVDFDEGLIWFDASLFDSNILVFTLTGDMALRIGWKSPVFVISIGGFHPSFNEVPSDLTGMKRLMLALLSGNNPRLTAQIYFAITSNTVQSGAKVELYAEAAGFNVYGYIGYDLLVQFSPFYFIVQIYAGLALRSGTSTIAGISVRCELSGPTPWNANGEASLKILFFEISVGFNETWGQLPPAQPVETEDILELVYQALNDDRNWRADLPANTSQTVSLKEIELPDESIIIHPFGVLSASQKIVPLEFEINKFGHKKPLDDTQFTLDFLGEKEDVTEEFAIANFIELNDSQKLSRKSFEKMKSGITLKADNSSTAGVTMQKEVNYEFSYVHRKKGLKIGLVSMFVNLFNVLVGGSSVSQNIYAVSNRVANNAPAEVIVSDGNYSVVNVDDMNLHAEGFSSKTEAEAYHMHDQLIKNDPTLKDKIQVVSQFEL